MIRPHALMALVAFGIGCEQAQTTHVPKSGPGDSQLPLPRPVRRVTLQDVDDAIQRGELKLAEKLLPEAQTEGEPAVVKELEKKLAAATEAARAAADAEVSKLNAEVEAQAQKRNWRETHVACLSLATHGVAQPETCKQASIALEQEEQRAAQIRRETEILAAAQAALDVAKDANRCDTPTAVAAAWTRLRDLEPKPKEKGFPTAKKAVAALEQCRRKIEKVLTAGVRKLMTTQREQWARSIESELLNRGFDVQVSLRGKHKDHAALKWVLFSRPIVHQIVTQDGFLSGVERIGFRSVTFSDGFYESYKIPLTPQNEDNAGKLVLQESGLGEPLKL